MRVEFQKRFFVFTVIAKITGRTKVARPVTSAATQRNCVVCGERLKIQHSSTKSAPPTKVRNSCIPLIRCACSTGSYFSCVSPSIHCLEFLRVLLSPILICNGRFTWISSSIIPHPCSCLFRILPISGAILFTRLSHIFVVSQSCVTSILIWMLNPPMLQLLQSRISAFSFPSKLSDFCRLGIFQIFKVPAKFTISVTPFRRASLFWRQWVPAFAQHLTVSLP